MSDDEKFLARWSRRKQEVAKEAKLDQTPVPEPQSGEARPEDQVKSEDPVDLTKLPSLDDIAAETDVAGFLQKGVPTELARAALRRAWTSDPAIRDFVGLQENDWVFNKPGPEEGFGPIGPDTDVSKLLAQVFGEAPKDSPPESQAESAGLQAGDTSAPVAMDDAVPSDQPNSVAVASEDDALHKKTADTSPTRHSHGSALPRPISES